METELRMQRSSKAIKLMQVYKKKNRNHTNKLLTEVIKTCVSREEGENVVLTFVSGRLLGK